MILRPHRRPIICNRPWPSQVCAIDNGAASMIQTMMRNGLAVNRDGLADLGRFLDRDCQRLSDQAAEMLNREVNLGSADQIAELLFMTPRELGGLEVHKYAYNMLTGECMGRAEGGPKVLKMTAVKQRPTVGKIDIEPYLERHPLVRLRLDYMKRDKLKGTYCDGIGSRLRWCGKTQAWRVYPTINPTAARTGRYASENPNGMTIPTRGDLAKLVKNAFEASPGCVLIECDYSQIEMRMAAHVSGARVMNEVFHAPKYVNGKKNRAADMHYRTCQMVYGLPYDELDDRTHRYPMKRAGFLILYMGEGPALQAQLNAEEAQDPAHPKHWEVEGPGGTAELIDNWYGVYPEVRDMQENIIAEARRWGNVCTIFGRVRPVPEVRSVHRWVRSAGERQACNQPLQGSAADILKIALADLEREYNAIQRDTGIEIRPLLTVHDQVLVEVEEDAAEIVAQVTEETMEGAAELDDTPLEADTKMGKRWGELKELKRAA